MKNEVHCLYDIKHFSHQVSFEFHQKLANGQTRRVFKSPVIEWCSMMDGSKNANRFTKAFIDAIKEKSPEMFILCPYFGKYEFQNLTISKTFLTIMPIGSYIVLANITDPVFKTRITFKGGVSLKN